MQLHAIIYSSHKQDLKPKPGSFLWSLLLLLVERKMVRGHDMPVDTCALIPTYAKKFGGGVSEGASKTGKPGNEVGNIIY